jgi:peptidoglycan/xylan/chitin deacetylase (PgdA/CDA1 family)
VSSSPLQVALTFDAEGGEDLPGHNIGAQGWADILDLLDQLDQRNIQSTFFLQGDWVARHPDLARRTRDDGHLLGNHTLNHRNLGKHPDQLRDQVETSARVVRAVLDVDLRPWFRLPYFSGNQDRAIQNELMHLGWNTSTETAKPVTGIPRPKNGEQVATNVLEDADQWSHGPLVVLFHTWPRPTAEGLSLVIENLRSRQVQFVTVAALSDSERKSLRLADPSPRTP